MIVSEEQATLIWNPLYATGAAPGTYKNGKIVMF
jgi:hypothetical protein